MSGKLRSGSMCTGYGGLDMAVQAVIGNTELAWAADNDPGASAIIAHRLPDVLNLGDIRTVPWEDMPPVDILCAGFPCQPVSAAGKRKGLQDERWLWPAIADAIGRMALRPRLLVLENVPRLLTIDGGAALSQIIGSLAGLGYVGCYGIYSAAEAGAPHLRKRWFLLAAHADSEPGQQWRITDTGETQSRGTRPDTGGPDRAASIPDAQGVGRPARQPVTDRHRPGPGHHEVIPDSDSIRRTVRRNKHIAGSPGTPTAQNRRNQAEHYGESNQRLNPAARASLSDSERIGLQRERAEARPDQEWQAETPWRRRSSDSRGNSLPDPGSARLERTVTARAWDDQERHRQAEDSTADGSSVCCAGLDWQEYEPAVRRWEMTSGYPVPYPVEPGRNGNSRMTAEFPEWMMGLPPGWVTDVPGLSRSAKIRAIGNGVVPQQAAMAITSLLNCLAEST